MEIAFFYITVGSESEVISLGNLAVEKRLAACANVFPIQSTFPGNGQIQHDHEFVLVLKTMIALKNPLRSFINEQHSYDVPCILSWHAEVNEEYGKWMKEQLEVRS